MNTSNLKNNNRNKMYNLYKATYGKVNQSKVMTKEQFFEMLKYYTKVFVFRNNSGIRSAILYWPGPLGKKMGLGFGNSKFQKNVTLPFIAKKLKNANNNSYAEMSHTLEEILTKHHGLRPITNKEIIKKVLPNARNIQSNGQYTRTIGTLGTLQKRLYGHPKVQRQLASRL